MAKAFEKWAREQGLDLRKLRGTVAYRADETTAAHDAWQAAQEDDCRRMCEWCRAEYPLSTDKKEHAVGVKWHPCAASPIREGMED